MNPLELSALAKSRAAELGFEVCGVTNLADSAAAAALDAWLANSHHGQMGYMARQAPKRRSPSRAWSAAKSVVVVLHSYYQPQPSVRGQYRVARYAQGIDYHTVIAKKLDRLGADLAGAAGRGSWRSYVDAGPLPERELARRAGLGWVGKNTMLIHPLLGSFTFIGALLTDLELAMDQPFEADRCGTCSRCLDACPTNAFPSPRVLDSRRCISYLTIEAPDEIPASLRSALGDNLFGCDICQDVCPWNVKFAVPTREDGYRTPEGTDWPTLEEIIGMDERGFDDRFGDTAIERTRLAGLKRNARVVLENQKVD